MSVYNQAKKTLAKPIIINSSKSTSKSTSKSRTKSKSTSTATATSTATSTSTLESVSDTELNSPSTPNSNNGSSGNVRGRIFNRSRGSYRSRGSNRRNRGGKTIEKRCFSSTPAATITPRGNGRGSFLTRRPVIRRKSSKINDETPTRNAYSNRVKRFHNTDQTLEKTLSNIKSRKLTSTGTSKATVSGTGTSTATASGTGTSTATQCNQNGSLIDNENSEELDNEQQNDNSIATSSINNTPKFKGTRPSTSHDLISPSWRIPVDVPTHINNRIIINKVIYQYYDRIPQVIIDIKDEDSSLDLIDQMSEKYPVYGVTHLFYVNKFSLPIDCRTRCTYLGHKLDPYWVEMRSSYKASFAIPDHVVVCDSFLWRCNRCADLKRDTIIFSASTKFYGHIRRHLAVSLNKFCYCFLYRNRKVKKIYSLQVINFIHS